MIINLDFATQFWADSLSDCQKLLADIAHSMNYQGQIWSRFQDQTLTMMILEITLTLLVCSAIAMKIYTQLKKTRCQSMARLDGKTVLVTGANSGFQDDLEDFFLYRILMIRSISCRDWVGNCQGFGRQRCQGDLGMQEHGQGCGGLQRHL